MGDKSSRNSLNKVGGLEFHYFGKTAGSQEVGRRKCLSLLKLRVELFRCCHKKGKRQNSSKIASNPTFPSVEIYSKTIAFKMNSFSEVIHNGMWKKTV
jgi:hypothetical protein